VKNISIKELSPTYSNRISAIKKHISGNILLDAGCSDGFIHGIIKKKGLKITGVDINKSDIDIAKLLNPDNTYIVSSLYKLPFKNESFDTIICSEVLEHLDKDYMAISELYRVLKKGGKVIITVPSSDFPFCFDPINFLLKDKHTNFGIWGFGHVRLYSFKKMSKMLENSGFKVVKKERISHGLVGFFENSYLLNILQPKAKSDPKNKDTLTRDVEKLKSALMYKPPKALIFIRDLINRFDMIFFGKSRRSVNILLVGIK